MPWLWSNMIWWLPIIVMGLFLAFVAHFHRDFLAQEDLNRKWLRRWALRGVVAPLVAWVFLNTGRSSVLPPLTWGIAKLKFGGHAGTALAAQISVAALFIVCWWTVLTLGWFLTRVYQRARNTEDLVIALVVSTPLLALLLWLFSGLGVKEVGFVAFFWLAGVLQYSLNVANFTKPPPAYSRAIGKMKFGKYREAELAIIGELEKCENDFDGWLLLAELYASQFHDLDEAERTIHDLCGDPQTTLPQVSIALHKLADWQLHYGRNPAAARRALEDLCRRMPETHLAAMARNRLHQLPADRDELARQQEVKKVRLSAPVEYFATPSETAGAPANSSRAEDANELVSRLNENPDDVPAREKLARVFAEQLDQPGVALDQLDLLLGMPEQPDHKRAEWLGLKGALQTRLTGEQSAKETLERLVHEFPQSAQAFDAQRRLSIMKAYARRPVVPIIVRPPQSAGD